MKKNLRITTIVLAALLLNVVGKYIADYFSLPLWLDSFGTCMVAYMLGPISGAIVGVGMNVAYGLFDRISLVYGIVSMAIGLCCGIMARRKYFETFYGSCQIAMTLTLLSFFLSMPLNFLFHDGYCMNVWGNGVLDLMAEMGVIRAIAAALGEFSIDFVDKYIVCVAFYGVLQLRHRKKIKKEAASVAMVLCLVLSGSLLQSPVVAEAEEVTEYLDYNKYTTTIYDDGNGLPGGEANDLTFGGDGYLWVGTYGGLYKYDGSTFQLKNDFDTVKNVNCLYTDEEGRIWIGTNDSGLAVCVGDEVTNVLDSSNGLSADSVKCVKRDSHGYYFVGTSKALNIVSLHTGISVSHTFPEVQYTYSIATARNGYTAVVDGSGKVFLFYDAKLLYSSSGSNGTMTYSSVCFDDAGRLYIGSYDNYIYVYEVDQHGMKQIDTIETGRLKNIRSMELLEGVIYICADNGAGYIHNWNVREIGLGEFSTSIDNVGVDYQGNLWFTSSRLGLLKVTETAFANIYNRDGIATDVVNAVVKWRGVYYVGTDDGLDIFDRDYHYIERDSLEARLKGQRVRNLMVDSRNHLWISITSGEGLLEVFPDGQVRAYNEGVGTICNRFRSTCELQDGVIAAAEDGGIDFIKDGKIIHSITPADGLGAGMILSLCQTEDGTLYAGTDGGGMAIIRDYKLEKNLTKEDGLTSGVILRIIPDETGLYLVATNGIFYYTLADQKLTYLKYFPYYNCFDIQIDLQGNLWVLSSAGVYVLNREQMFADKEPEYTLFNTRTGLVSSITANSWAYLSENGMLYICCDDGCYELDTSSFDLTSRAYRMSVDYIEADGKRISISRGDTINIEGNVQDFSIHPVVLNYSLNEPYVGYQLIGHDEAETIVSSKELQKVVYSNLKNGTYSFVIRLYSDSMNNVLEMSSYTVIKKMRIYDHTWFKLYFVVVYMIFLIMVTWMIVRKRGTEQLKRAQERYMAEKAIAADKAKSMFLANMSHEIRTPINAILGTNEMIQREAKDGNILEYSNDINSAGRTLLALINDILDFSKIESGRMDLVLVEYDLKQLIGDLESIIMDRANRKKLTLKIDVDNKLPRRLYGDDVRVRQIITNLLTNAVKYTETGSIQLSVTREDMTCEPKKGEDVLIRVMVEDTGIGIKEEDMEKLYKSFTRIEEERNRNIEGTGLGINITTNLLGLMGSKLEVKSVYGEGSVFGFVLKQKVVEETPIGDYHIRSIHRIREEGAKKLQRTAPDAKVLIVDDTEMNLKVEARLLKRTKVQMDTASNGKQALELLRSNRYDIVFLDHMMPEMDGIETLARAREEDIVGNTPVIVLTANATSGAREMYLQAGFDDYLSKPVKGDDIERMLFERISPELVREEEV